MTTPAAKEETLEQIAERLVRTYCAVIEGVKLTLIEQELAAQITAALRNEREACAKVAEKDDFTHSSGYRCHRGEFIATKIRKSGSKSNAE